MTQNHEPIKLDTKHGARVLREVLRDAFPNTQFSVRCSFYAGGSSIRVSYKDGPPEVRVSDLARKFQGRGFDGMSDSSYVTGNTIKSRGILYAAPFAFVSVSRDTSHAAHEDARKVLAQHYGAWTQLTEFDRMHYTHNLVRCSWIDAGHLRIDDTQDVDDMARFGRLREVTT